MLPSRHELFFVCMSSANLDLVTSTRVESQLPINTIATIRPSRSLVSICAWNFGWVFWYWSFSTRILGTLGLLMLRTPCVLLRYHQSHEKSFECYMYGWNDFGGLTVTELFHSGCLTSVNALWMLYEHTRSRYAPDLRCAYRIAWHRCTHLREDKGSLRLCKGDDLSRGAVRVCWLAECMASACPKLVAEWSLVWTPLLHLDQPVPSECPFNLRESCWRSTLATNRLYQIHSNGLLLLLRAALSWYSILSITFTIVLTLSSIVLSY